ncbi:hypothetical protein RHPLAN_12780 [Rhodoplanes sp. Z2-YC6860]|nr:hypothetical protein RHPLAN_12780 [Rhodoplanes sp. Z2-YC6860]
MGKQEAKSKRLSEADQLIGPEELTEADIPELLSRLDFDYSFGAASPSTSSFLGGYWWSLGEAADYIENSIENTDSDASPLFTGLGRLEKAIRSGKIGAFGSIDAGPVSELSEAAWTEFILIPYFHRRLGQGRPTYEVLVRSRRSYRASALNDHSFAANEWLPAANAPHGEPGYYRIVSNVFVKEADVAKLFPQKTDARKEPGGRKHRRLLSTIPVVKVRGKSVFPDPGDATASDITRAVIKHWEEGDRKEGREKDYLFPTELQAVLRFYEKLRHGSSDI